MAEARIGREEAKRLIDVGTDSPLQKSGASSTNLPCHCDKTH
jgi:hypothetical protein